MARTTIAMATPATGEQLPAVLAAEMVPGLAPLLLLLWTSIVDTNAFIPPGQWAGSDPVVLACGLEGWPL